MTINNAIHSAPLTNVSYVATNGSDTLGDGSIIRPFLTIGHAVSVAATSSAIMVAAGSYTESINFAGVTQLTIQAIGGTDYGSVFITGTQSFTSTSNHITFIGIAFNNPSAAMASIAASAHIAFQNCVFNASAATNPAISVTGAITGEIVIRDCLITGTVSNAATAFFQVYIIGQHSTACNVTCSNGATLVLNCPNIGLITHSGGVLELNNIAGIQATAGNCITSTAASSASNQLLMFAINLEQSNLTYGSLVKSGTCLYIIANSNYDPTTSFTGTRQNYGVFAQDMSANYTPTNYTAADASVKGNLSGADTAIGLKAAKGANSDITSLSGLTTALSGAQGGTGVANTGKTITLGGNLTTSGAFATTLTSTATTSVTLPTTGTLATTAGSLQVANNLSDLASASTGRTNLGVAIGTNVQAYSAQLDSAAAVTDGIVAHTAANTFTPRTITGTLNRLAVTNGNAVSGNPTLDIDSAYVGQTSITTLGTIATGTWQGTLVDGQYGGTGVNNSGKTITLGGNLTTSGAFATTLTVTAATNVTLPTTGTLVNTAVTSLSSLATVGTVTSGTWSSLIKGYTEAKVTANTGASYTIDLSQGNVFELTLNSAAVTLSFSNVPASNAVSVSITLIQDATGSRTVTWPTGTIWAGGVAPTLTTTATHVDIFELVSPNNGTTWRGFAAGLNFTA